MFHRPSMPGIQANWIDLRGTGRRSRFCTAKESLKVRAQRTPCTPSHHARFAPDRLRCGALPAASPHPALTRRPPRTLLARQRAGGGGATHDRHLARRHRSASCSPACTTLTGTALIVTTRSKAPRSTAPHAMATRSTPD